MTTNKNAQWGLGAKHYTRPDNTNKTQYNQRETLRRKVKTAIVRLALLGLLPAAVAEWLIQHGGMRHV